MLNSPLPDKFDQIMPLGPKVARPVGLMFYIGLYREDKNKFLSDTTCSRVLIFCL